LCKLLSDVALASISLVNKESDSKERSKRNKSFKAAKMTARARFDELVHKVAGVAVGNDLDPFLPWMRYQIACARVNEPVLKWLALVDSKKNKDEAMVNYYKTAYSEEGSDRKFSELVRADVPRMKDERSPLGAEVYKLHGDLADCVRKAMTRLVKAVAKEADNIKQQEAREQDEAEYEAGGGGGEYRNGQKVSPDGDAGEEPGDANNGDDGNADGDAEDGLHHGSGAGSRVRPQHAAGVQVGRKRKHSAVTADHNDAEEGLGAAAGAAAGAASGAAAGAPVRSRRQSLVALGRSIVRRSVPAALARVQTGLQAMLESLGVAAAADHSSSSAAASSSSSADPKMKRVLDALKAADAAISKLPSDYLKMVNEYLSEVGRVRR